MARPLHRTSLRELVPGAVVVREAFADASRVRLLPEETAVVAGAVASRQREFATVRACARQALAAVGVAPAPILPLGRSAPVAARRAPRWPEGIVGSMTHCDGYRAAAVARCGAVAAIGIDAEPHLPLPPGVAAVVALPEERRALAGLRVAAPGVAWDRLLFSAKESVYKAWSPLTGRWLGFDECTVALRPDSGTFSARLRTGPAPSVTGRRIARFDGRWCVLAPPGSAGELIVTAVVVAAAPAAATGGRRGELAIA